jgi:hypothetical protein
VVPHFPVVSFDKVTDETPMAEATFFSFTPFFAANSFIRNRIITINNLSLDEGQWEKKSFQPLLPGLLICGC